MCSESTKKIENEKYVLDRVVSAGGGAKLDDFKEFPKYIQLETTSECTARCAMCGINEWRKKMKSDYMEDSLFYKIADEIIANKKEIQSIALYIGNEPLLDERLCERISHFAKEGLLVNFSTNGSLMDKDMAKKVLQSGVDRVIFSIDSLDKEIFEKIRKGLKFEEILGNTLAFIQMRNQLKSNVTIKINIVENQFNTENMESIVDFWEKLLDKSKGDFVRVEKFVLSFQNSLKRKDEMDTKGAEIYEKINIAPCYPLWNTMTIKTDGQVALCCIDQCRNFVLGDLRKQSIKEIWQESKALQNIRKLHIKGGRKEFDLCRNCACWL